MSDQGPGAVYVRILGQVDFGKHSKVANIDIGFSVCYITKKSNLVWDLGEAVWTPHDAHVGCEKLQVKQKMAKFKLEKNDTMRPIFLHCYTN